MKNLWIVCLTALFFVRCGAGNDTLKTVYRVTVPGNRPACPVVIGELPEWVRSAVVTAGELEIPSQLDRPLNELAFVADISGSREFSVVYSSKPADRIYPDRVHAQLVRINPDRTRQEVDTVASDRDGAKPQLLHHGPAFESELAAYRVCFDDGQAVDTYGKKRMCLELARSGWTSTDEQRAADFGYDNLRVGGSVGVGALKGWDARRRCATDITDYRRREARILARGPVRTVVEMRVEGWRYCGREIDLTSRYILYAGHGEMLVENTLDGDLEGLLFATGIVRTAQSETVRDVDVVASLGCDYPAPDCGEEQREYVGLAVAVRPQQVVSQIDDGKNYLFQMRPDAQGRIDCVAEMLWRRSDWLQDRSDDECMLGLLEGTRKALRKVVVARIR